MWIVIGIIIFIISLLVHKSTYEYRTWNSSNLNYKYEDKLKFPLWLLLVFIILSFIPILNLMYFIVGLIIYVLGIFNSEIYFKPYGFLEKIIKLLNKEI